MPKPWRELSIMPLSPLLIFTTFASSLFRIVFSHHFVDAPT
jgi:hypothetical protein